MTLQEIQELAGHREVSPWIVKLVGDAVAREREKVQDELNAEATMVFAVLKNLNRTIQMAIDRERDECADIAENWRCNGMPRTVLADQIRARGRSEALTNLNKAAEDMGEEL